MEKLFNRLVSENLYFEWAEILDWLFDDDRFSKDYGWSPGYVGAFIKKVKRLPKIREKKNYFYDSIKNLSFPQSKSQSIKIYLSNGDGEARDIVRHIRNGIAHGRTKIYRKGELYIEIIDYTNTGRQSAYIYMPLNYINQIYHIYKEVEKSKKNCKRNHRKTKERR